MTKNNNNPAPVLLVGCSKSKLDCTARASELYTGTGFRMARRLAELRGAHWGIVSALYGLVLPHWYLRPYDQRLGADRLELRLWAHETATRAMGAFEWPKAVELYMGATYADPLRLELEARGVAVAEPLRGLGTGARLHRLRELLELEGVAA